LDLEKASHWIVDLPGFVTRVALCVNAPLEEASRISQLPYVDALQLHGDETSDFCQSIALLGRSWIRAVRLESAEQIGCLADWGTRNVLIDAAVAGAYGGTGARLDLNLAAESVRRCKGLHLTLAGGLEPENVAEAVRLVKPYAVDVASGVESAPGRKDAAKMRDFVQAVAAACC